jgi:ubiquinone/menaquinone biosynthesis C-methylase UbiE
MKDVFKNQTWMWVAKSDGFHQTAQHRFSYEWTKNYVKAGNKILDIGCFFGDYLEFFKNSGVELYGLDIYKNIMEDNARKFPYMKFYTSSVLSMPFPDNYFDVVTLWETIEHVPEGTELDALKEIRRVMKKDGLLFIGTPNNCIRSNILDTLQILFKKHRHYSKIRIASLIESAGFNVNKIEYHGRYLEALYWLYHIILKRTLRKHPFDTRFGRWLDKKVEKEFNSNNGFMEIWLSAKAT